MKTKTIKIFGEIPNPSNEKNMDGIMKFAKEVIVAYKTEQKKVRLGVQTKITAWKKTQAIFFFTGFVEIDKVIYPYTGYEYKEEKKITIIF